MPYAHDSPMVQTASQLVRELLARGPRFYADVEAFARSRGVPRNAVAAAKHVVRAHSKTTRHGAIWSLKPIGPHEKVEVERLPKPQAPARDPKTPTHAQQVAARLKAIPLSTSCIVIDRDGRVLAERPAVEQALRLARLHLPDSVAVVGLPTGKVLAAVHDGLSAGSRTAQRAAERWRESGAATISAQASAPVEASPEAPEAPEVPPSVLEQPEEPTTVLDESPEVPAPAAACEHRAPRVVASFLSGGGIPAPAPKPAPRYVRLPGARRPLPKKGKSLAALRFVRDALADGEEIVVRRLAARARELGIDREALSRAHDALGHEIVVRKLRGVGERGTSWRLRRPDEPVVAATRATSAVRREEAMALLREMLVPGGPEVDGGELLARATERGIIRRTMHDARVRLGIVARRKTSAADGVGKSGGIMWRWPAQPAQAASQETAATCGAAGSEVAA